MTWLESFVDFAHGRLGDSVRESLWARGASDSQIRLYRVGHVEGQLPDLDYPKDFLKWCWEGRRLPDNFVLPLTNSIGQVKGLQFRSADPDKKGYSDYIPVADEPLTFGLSQAMQSSWDAGYILLTEGVFDVFPVQRFFPNSIPALTNKLSGPMARLLQRLVTDVYFVFDMDESGRKAAKRALYSYKDSRLRLHDLCLSRPKTLDGTRRVKDPGELWETWGDDRFGQHIRELVMEDRNA